MTNTTEMPEQIWARYRIDHPVENEWSLKRHHDSDVSYTRTDTIPSKAEVAREFLSEATRNFDPLGGDVLEDFIEETLKEWDDA